MALTDKKRKFAAALLSGASNRDAAIHAGYSEKTAPQAGSRLAKDPDVLAELERKDIVNKAKEQANSEGRPFDLLGISRMFSDPLDFVKAMVNDTKEDPKLRLEAAKTWIPYVHAKKGESGKKVIAQQGAEKVANRFAPTAPPRLAAVGGRKV